MLLSEPEIQLSLERVQAAFPSFANWEHQNEIDQSYPGFALWGEFVADPDEIMSRSFFVTFDTDEATWTGHLTIGKPCYYWSSADCGDAFLVDTGRCETLEAAITALKEQMAELFRALLGSP